MRNCLIFTLMLILTSCASSVTSYNYDPQRAADGLVYHLPATELVVKASYNLICQTTIQGPTGPKEIPAKIALTDSTVTPRTIADPRHAYVIDPDKLSNLTSTVTSAKLTFKDGLLKGVTYKAASQIRPIITEAIKLAATVGVLGPLPVRAGTPPPLKCDESLLAGDVASLAAAQQLVKGRTQALDAADRRMQQAPSEANALAVTHAEKRLNEAVAELKALTARAFSRTVEFPYLPPTDPDQLPRSTSVVGLASAEHNVHLVDLTPFRSWFEHLTLGPETVASLGSGGDLVNFKMVVELNRPDEGAVARAADAAAPGIDGWPGIYYRRAVHGDVAIRHEPYGFETDPFERRFQKVPVLQYGQTARLELKNGAFESRGFELGFDDAGQLLTYETSSATAPAQEALATATGVPQAIVDVEKAALQREIDLLELEKKRIDAKKAVDAATM